MVLPCVASRRWMSPFFSRRMTIWFMAWAVTKTRRASWAEESPSRSRRTLSAVYSGVLMPQGASASSRPSRNPRSSHLTR